MGAALGVDRDGGRAGALTLLVGVPERTPVQGGEPGLALEAWREV